MQSIIVYRNPAEAVFWESGLAFPIIAGCVMAVVGALVFDFLARKGGIKNPTMAAIIGAFAFGTGTLVALM